MTSVEGKLAIWHRLYRELGEAHERLTASADARARAQLESEVRRLKRESESALRDVNAAISSEKAAAAQPGLGQGVASQAGRQPRSPGQAPL